MTHPACTTTTRRTRALVPVSVGLVTAVLLATGTPATPAVASPDRPVDVAETVALTGLTGFADVESDELVPTAPVTSVPVDGHLSIVLPSSGTAALADVDDGVVINGRADDGTITVVKGGTGSSGFAVVTGEHGTVEHRYPVRLGAGTTLVRAADGGLDHVDAGGAVLGHIEPAYAVDSTGAPMPAAYAFDAATDELVVTADTTTATGAVLIDPYWFLAWRLVWVSGRMVWKQFWLWCQWSNCF